jgi:hypothetical protein
MTRTFAPVLLAALLGAIPACSWDGHFSVLGYSTKPNYDTRYCTVRVPVCKTRTRWTVTPAPGMEMDLTRAIVREIQTKTPYKVTQGDADTELLCTITTFQKNLLSVTQFNTVREAETVLTVELVWRDLRTGEILSKAARRMGAPGEPDPRQPLLATADSLLPPGTKPPAVTGAAPTLPLSGAVEADEEGAILDPVTKKKAVPIVVRSTANFRPELGESITTAMQRNIDRVAVQIVSAMEVGW